MVPHLRCYIWGSRSSDWSNFPKYYSKYCEWRHFRAWWRISGNVFRLCSRYVLVILRNLVTDIKFICSNPELVPKKYRFKTLGYMIFANHLSASAILIGYAFVAYTKPGWRSAYWWCFAWELSAAVLLFFFYHPPTFETKHKEDRKTKWQLLKQIDYIGLILFTAGCLFILLGVNWVCRNITSVGRKTDHNAGRVAPSMEIILDDRNHRRWRWLPRRSRILGSLYAPHVSDFAASSLR